MEQCLKHYQTKQLLTQNFILGQALTKELRQYLCIFNFWRILSFHIPLTRKLLAAVLHQYEGIKNEAEPGMEAPNTREVEGNPGK